MTLEGFWNLRNTIEAGLKLDLELGKIKPILLKEEKVYFKVYPDDTQASVLESMLAFNKKVNGKITHSITEKDTGRVGYYEYTEYRVTYSSVVPEITEALVKKCTHQALKGIMKLGKWDTIDCKLMQLFKDSKLSWEDLVDAHKIQCTF